MLTTVQFFSAASSSDCLRAGGVRELALVVVVEDEQAQRRAILAAGVAEHRDVAVRVAAGDDRPLPDRGSRSSPASPGRRRTRPTWPRRRRCHRARRRRRRGRSNCRSPARKGSRTSRRDRAHEVAVATGRDVVGEPVGLEVPEELDHRLVAALVVAVAERRMLAPFAGRHPPPPSTRRPSGRRTPAGCRPAAPSRLIRRRGSAS